MAAGKSSAWNDFVQIVMLTFLLCAVFFGAWGGYLVWRNGKLEQERNSVKRDLVELDKFLKREDNIERQTETKRRTQASQSDEDLAQAVITILGDMRDIEWVKGQNTESEDLNDGRVEHTLDMDFHERPLRNYLNLFQHLENKKPNILIKDFKLDNKAKRGEVADQWTGSVEFVVYSEAKK